MTYPVTLNTIDDMYPINGNPQSLTKVKQLFIKNFTKTGNCDVMMMINLANGNVTSKSIAESSGFDCDTSMRGVEFKLDYVKEGETASFELELVY